MHSTSISLISHSFETHYWLLRLQCISALPCFRHVTWNHILAYSFDHVSRVACALFSLRSIFFNYHISCPFLKHHGMFSMLVIRKLWAIINRLCGYSIWAAGVSTSLNLIYFSNRYMSMLEVFALTFNITCLADSIYAQSWSIWSFFILVRFSIFILLLSIVRIIH